jgi:hypothetical protein
MQRNSDSWSTWRKKEERTTVKTTGLRQIIECREEGGQTRTTSAPLVYTPIDEKLTQAEKDFADIEGHLIEVLVFQ